MSNTGITSSVAPSPLWNSVLAPTHAGSIKKTTGVPIENLAPLPRATTGYGIPDRGQLRSRGLSTAGGKSKDA
ncbi:hypothetical protein RUND412_006995, partial [Rhizina undulata]